MDPVAEFTLPAFDPLELEIPGLLDPGDKFALPDLLDEFVSPSLFDPTDEFVLPDLLFELPGGLELSRADVFLYPLAGA